MVYCQKSVSCTCRGRKSHCYNCKLSFKYKRNSNKTTLLSYIWHFKSVSSKTTNLICFEMRTTILKYLKEKTGKSYQKQRKKKEKKKKKLIKTKKNCWTRDLNSSVNVAVPTSFLSRTTPIMTFNNYQFSEVEKSFF